MTAVRDRELAGHLQQAVAAERARYAGLPGRMSDRMTDCEFMAYLDEMEGIRAWIRHMPPAEAFQLVREVIDKGAPDPHVILLSLTPDELVWLAGNHLPPEAS